MFVQITDNIDTDLGIANGTLGQIVGIVWGGGNNEPRPRGPQNDDEPGEDYVWKWDEREKIYYRDFQVKDRENNKIFTAKLPKKLPSAILVQLAPGPALERWKKINLPHLPDNVVPIEAKKLSIAGTGAVNRSQGGGSGRKTYFKLSQFPITCSDAFTVHKAQGQTYQCQVVLRTPRVKLASLYTALSRVTKLEYLHLETTMNPLSSKDYIVEEKLKTFLNSFEESTNKCIKILEKVLPRRPDDE